MPASVYAKRQLGLTQQREDPYSRESGAIGSSLREEGFPVGSERMNPMCKGGTLLMYLAPGSTPYLENI